MSKTEFLHVVPHGDIWAVRDQRGKNMWIFEAKSDAIDEAKKRARERNNSSRVIVHGKSGQIIQNTGVKSGLSDKAIRDAVRGGSDIEQKVSTGNAKPRERKAPSGSKR